MGKYIKNYVYNVFLTPLFISKNVPNYFFLNFQIWGPLNWESGANFRSRSPPPLWKAPIRNLHFCPAQVLQHLFYNLGLTILENKRS
jgi:hypothetical protein